MPSAAIARTPVSLLSVQMPTPAQEHEEDLARRVYSYFIFRLRQPEDAERLTKLSFERVWREANLGRETEQEPDLPVFAAARAVIAENPRPRGATRMASAEGDAGGESGSGSRLGNEL